MLQTIVNYEVVIWLAVLIIFLVVSLVYFIKDRHKENLTYYDYSEVKREVADLKRQLETIQNK